MNCTRTTAHSSGIKFFIATLTLAVFAMSTFAASHTWSGAVNGLFSNAGNWSSGGVPTLAETNAITFPASATRTVVTNDIGALKVSAFTFSGNNYIVCGASTITIEPNLINFICSGATNTIECSMTFVSYGYFSIGANDSLVLSGALSGTNGLVKVGAGNLYLKGAASNPLSGDLTVLSGELHFQKTGGASPYNGNSITIGTTNVSDQTQLVLYADDQIPDGANVSIQPSGALQMNGHSDKINTLTLYSGTIDTGAGTLGMYGGLTLSPRYVNQFNSESPTITGSLQFLGATASINVTSNACNIDANITESGSTTTVNKTGIGTLRLLGGGNFAGQFNILQGTVYAGTVNSLGALNGITTVTNGASLILNGGFSTSESMIISGSGDAGTGALQVSAGGATYCYGNITVSNLARVNVPLGCQLQLNGVVKGTGGLEKIGDGELWLSGNTTNTFTGISFVNAGRLRLVKPVNVRALGSVTVTNNAELVFGNDEQMDNTGVLSLYTGAIVNLTNRNETVGGLNIGGGAVIDTGTGTLTLAGGAQSVPPFSLTNTPATIRGNLSLGGGVRSVATTNSTIDFDCLISDGSGIGGLNLIGGTMELLRSNSFTGVVGVSGTCVVSNAFGFGAPGGGVAATNAIIRFAQSNLVVSGETLTAAGLASVGFLGVGSNVWNGPVNITSNQTTFYYSAFNRPDSKSFTITGTISGVCDLLYIDSGTLILTASNTFVGRTQVTGTGPFYSPSGQLIVRNAHAFGNSAQGVTVAEGGRLRLELPDGAEVTGVPLTFSYFGDFNTTAFTMAGPGTNTWSGPIINDVPPLQIAVEQGALNLNAPISGYGSLNKTGSGQLILSGLNANTFAGETVVNDGTLVLSKANGAQAVSNLSVSNYSDVVWGANDQMADNATLRLISGSADLNDHNETCTQLVLDQGTINTGTGILTVLGDIDSTRYPADLSGNGIYGRLRFNGGTHRMFSSTADRGLLTIDAEIAETSGSATLNATNLLLSVSRPSTFTGPFYISGTELRVGNTNALGSPVQGLIMDQTSTIVLDLPHGQGVVNEPLIVTNNSDLPFSYFDYAHFGTTNYMEIGTGRTNFWSGPVVLQNSLFVTGQTNWSLDFRGPISAVGFDATLYSALSGSLFLTGSDANTLPYVDVSNGKLRLGKTGGASAFGFSLSAYGQPGAGPEIHVDAPGQMPANAYVSLDAASLLLHDHSVRVGALIANNNFSYVTGGNNPATSVTVSNIASAGSFEFRGDFNATLIKQGSFWMNMSGSFQNGDLIVEGGRLNRNCQGVVGQTYIAPGAIVFSYSPNIFNLGALSGAGILMISNNATWIGAGQSSTFSGTIVGTNTDAGFTKLGSGTLTLAGTVSGLASSLIQNGTLVVNTTMTNPVTVTPLAPGNLPTLAGTGTVGDVTLTGVGAQIAPGSTTIVPSYGALHVKNLTLGSGSLYQCEVSGTNAGVNMDQIDASGVVTLSGGSANFAAFGAGAVSNRYTIVKSTSPLSGTLLNYPEGNTIFPAPGRSMNVTYLLASGKEINLIEQPGVDLSNFRLTSLIPQSNGQITLNGTGNPGSVYFIEVNTNLATSLWVTLGSTDANFNGDIIFTDTNALHLPQCYYRFRLQ